MKLATLAIGAVIGAALTVGIFVLLAAWSAVRLAALEDARKRDPLDDLPPRE